MRLAGVRFARSEFTRRVISAELNKLSISGSTPRRYHAAWSSFGNFLVESEVLDANPLRSVKAPRPNSPREECLEMDDSMRLCNAQRAPYAALAALREGANVEISAALRTRRRDVDLERATVHAHGTKNSYRDRLVIVDERAWPAIVKASSGKFPDALIFEGATEERARAEHKRALNTLGLSESYTMHDARHSFAVRYMKAGVEPRIIANNLGHRDATMVLKLYGRYSPTSVDLRRAQLRRAK